MGDLMSLPIGPWRLTYTPGQWIVLAGPKLVAVMQPAPPKMSSLVNQLPVCHVFLMWLMPR